jgi:hypothetical protein
MSVEILRGLAKTTIFLNVDGVAGVDFDLSTGAAVNGLNENPVVALSDVGKKFDGTVGADVGLSINAGTNTALPPFFDAGVSVPLYSKTVFTSKVRTLRLLYRTHADLVVSHRKPTENLLRNAPLKNEESISLAYSALPLESLTSCSPSLTWMPRRPSNESTMLPSIFKADRNFKFIGPLGTP